MLLISRQVHGITWLRCDQHRTPAHHNPNRGLLQQINPFQQLLQHWWRPCTASFDLQQWLQLHHSLMAQQTIVHHLQTAYTSRLTTCSTLTQPMITACDALQQRYCPAQSAHNIIRLGPVVLSGRYLVLVTHLQPILKSCSQLLTAALF